MKTTPLDANRPTIVIGQKIRIGEAEFEVESMLDDFTIKFKPVNPKIYLQEELDRLLKAYDWREAVAIWFINTKKKTHSWESSCRKASKKKAMTTLKLLETVDNYSKETILNVLNYALTHTGEKFSWRDHIFTLSNLRNKTSGNTGKTKFLLILESILREEKFLREKNKKQAKISVFFSDRKRYGLSKMKSVGGLDFMHN